ncbi:S26 family signal peptidase [Novosphingobium profundi]|uniref:S26 family signal peptidase n=1 Tax=Novosphingobium profundi TaxID=1774954 RepID=UPI001CFCCA37|nr:S26 family signal peptidase [Novosphingobium profundi]
MRGLRTSRGDAPLRAVGDTLRCARMERTRRRKVHRRMGFLAALLCGLVLVTALVPPRARLVWNASASAPVGLYLVAPDSPVRTGDMVIARLPEAWRAWAARRRYLPANVPLVKRIAAGPGATICARGTAIWQGRVVLALRERRDGHGRPMPWWQGCRHLESGEYFLLMPEAAASFDGRYFGVTRRRDILGRARLLWAR